MYPVLFTIPGLNIPIYSYGVMLGLSMIVGWYLVMYFGQKDGINKKHLARCFIWTAVSALLGARLLYILTNPEYIQQSSTSDILNLQKGGMVAYGGFLGGFVGAWIYLRRQKIRLVAFADAAVPALASGLGITRVGCFLYGCDYGRPIPSDAPVWLKAIGLKFPNWQTVYGHATVDGAPAYLHHAHLQLVTEANNWSALVYPTQLLGVVNGWLAFALTLWVRKHSKYKGQTFLFFTAYYGLTRTLMEIIRGDTGRGGIYVFSTSQIIGVSTLLASIVGLYVMGKRARYAS